MTMLDPAARSPASSSTRRTPRRGRSAPRSPREIQPAHPGRLLARRRRRGARRAASSRSRAHADGAARPRDASPAPTCSSSPTPPTRSGSTPSTAARRGSTTPRSTRSSASSATAAGSSCSARPSRTSTATTSTSCSPASASRSRTPPSRTTSTTARPRPGCLADLDARRNGARPRPRSPASTRPASTAPATARPRPTAAAVDRPHATTRVDPRAPRSPRSPSTAPAASRSLADSDLFGDDCIGDLDHARALAQPRLLGRRAGLRRARRGAGAAARRSRRPALAGLQRGRRRAAPHPGARRLGRPLQARPGPHRRADRDDRRRGRGAGAALPAPGRLHRRRSPPTSPPGPAAGFGKPDFYALHSRPSAPSATARDGIEHLVVFPMYKQNASRDTCFEALHRPRPVARVGRRARVRAATTTPSSSRSSWSTTPTATTPSARSSSRRPSRSHERPPAPLRRDLLRPRGGALPPGLRRRRRDPPPQPAARRRLPARARPSSPRTPTSLWDLIHDRTHMHGDLPFDPFMIRQRSPYWMYSLEELRCDLTAFGEAVKLEREGFALRPPRPVRDPLRPPLPLPGHRLRVRNYDGLGGQLLFAFLHKEGYLHWTDNAPDDRLGPGRRRASAALRERVQALYHSGIDRSKLAPVDRRPRPRRRVRAAGRGLASGTAPAATCPRSRSRRSSSTSSATTSSRSASSTRS